MFLVTMFVVSLMAQTVKNLPAIQETWVWSLGWEDHGNPLQYSCLENPHGQRSLASYSPWSRNELDMTEQLSMMTNLNCTYRFQFANIKGSWCLSRSRMDSLKTQPSFPQVFVIFSPKDKLECMQLHKFVVLK